MIEIVDLRKVYGHGKGTVVALDGLSLNVVAKDRLAIVGRSGSGKSTLLNLLAGLDRPSSGSISVAGCRLDEMTKNQLAFYRCQQVGVVFQSFRLFPHLSALQNVEVPMALAGVSPKSRQKRAQELLQIVGLEHRWRHRPNSMSGGEQQRVAIARALANQPDLLLADEPTGNLDSTTAANVEQVLLDVCDSTGTTLAVVTHDESLAQRVANLVVRLADGKRIGETPNGADRESD